MPAHGHLARRPRDGGEKGYDTGIRAHHPFDKDWRLPVYVANFVLMEYGTGAIFGCPSGDQRDFEFAQVRAGVRAGDPTARRRPATFALADEAYEGPGDDQLVFPRRARYRGRVRGGRAPPRGDNARRQARRAALGQLPPARLGHLAPALLGLPDSGHPLRRLRRRAGAARGLPVELPEDATSISRATRSTGTRPGST